MNKTLMACVLAIAAGIPHGAAAMELATARGLVKAAVEYAQSHEAPGGAIAVVDAGGQLVMLERLDNTFPAAPAIATGKARTAALFRRATRDLEDTVNNGRTTMVTLTDVTPFTPLRGGIPIMADGKAIGAIGVSGAASAQQDDEIAQAAVDKYVARLAAVAPAPTHLDARAVAAAFAKGERLAGDQSYQVFASRRDNPGEAEVHTVETDIFYVIDGTATLVTGGELVDPRNTEAGEIRGNSIRGGQSTQLGRGDVIVIPRGLPHWFAKVDAPFTYYVVKSAS